MSAITLYNTLKTAIEGQGYKQVPDLLNIEEIKTSHIDKSFILQPIGSMEDQEFTGKALDTEHQWKLEIVYHQMTSTERVTNYDLFHTLKRTLYALDDFNKYTAEPTFLRLGTFTNNSVGTLQFLYGREGS